MNSIVWNYSRALITVVLAFASACSRGDCDFPSATLDESIEKSLGGAVGIVRGALKGGNVTLATRHQRSSILRDHPDLRQAILDEHFTYMFCTMLAKDSSMSAPERAQAMINFRMGLSGPPSPPEAVAAERAAVREGLPSAGSEEPRLEPATELLRYVQDGHPVFLITNDLMTYGGCIGPGSSILAGSAYKIIYTRHNKGWIGEGRHGDGQCPPRSIDNHRNDTYVCGPTFPHLCDQTPDKGWLVLWGAGFRVQDGGVTVDGTRVVGTLVRGPAES